MNAILAAIMNQGIDKFIGPLVKKLPKETLIKLREMQADKVLPILSIIFSSIFPGDKSQFGNTLNNLITELSSELSEKIGEQSRGTATREKGIDIKNLFLNPLLANKATELLEAFVGLFEGKNEDEKKAIQAVLGEMSGIEFLELLNRDQTFRDRWIKEFAKVKVKVSFGESLKRVEQHPVAQKIMTGLAEKMCQHMEKINPGKAVNMRLKLGVIKEREGGVL